MLKLAFYGKGGIGKSTTVSNIALACAEKNLKVVQIGCDPKADSTSLLLRGGKVEPVLEQLRKGGCFSLGEISRTGDGGVICVESGGPAPGVGCAGRGIIAALETLEKKVLSRNGTPISFSTMFWGMSFAAAFPCPCVTALRTGSIF